MNPRYKGISKRRYNLTLVGALAALMVFAAATLLATAGVASADPPTGSISGVVSQAATDTPVVGAVVFVNDSQTGAAQGNTSTGADGSYTVSGLATGTYRVHVNATAQGYPLRYYDGASDAESATLVSVVNGIDTSSIDFTLPSGGSISGVVLLASTDTPVANADVWAVGYDGGGGNGTRTTADGTYTITGLAPGDYRVQAQGEGLVQEFYNGTTDWDQANAVTVTAGATTPNIDFSLGVGGSVSGIVYEPDGVTPVQDAVVMAQLYNASWPQFGPMSETETKPDGTYTITGLAPGTYLVAADAEDQGLALEFYGDTFDPQTATSVTVTSGSDTGGIDFTLELGGSVSGTVYQADGTTPVPGMAVVAVESSTGVMLGFTMSGPDGTYTLNGLHAGQYLVQAMDFKGMGYASEFYDNVSNPESATAVTVVVSGDTPGIDFTLDAAQ